ncbi:MAG: hypothetical protein WAM39_08610 [Bryobacteraceae bacterium]
MNVSALQHIRKAVQTLNPHKVRALGERDLKIGLYAATPGDYARMEEFFVQDLSPARRSQALTLLHRGPDPRQVLEFDLAIYDESVLAPSRALVFHSRRPERLVEQVLDNFDQSIALPLAKTFLPFRMPYVDLVIRTTCRENAIFSMATALPDIIPSLIELPWAMTEFASDTAVLTANQIKMAFLLAAASDREAGYREQRREIAMVIGSAFGWRALARQLIGKIPFGGGLIPKAGIAYAATKLIGSSLERLYRVGYTYTREEREQIYAEAFIHGKRVASSILKKVRPDLAGKYSSHPGAKEHQSTSG